uniref:BHLH domain-containing protein n=1 Tax=Schistosoma mansoni TaxID=6183 RepID=A0A5K4FF04_SCHMA
MDDRIHTKTYDRVMIPTRMNSMREMDPSDLHRINQFQLNNNPFLYHEILNSNTSSALITGMSRPTLENNILDSINSSKTLYDNSLNDKPMLNQCLEHSANLLPYIYTNTSNDNMIYHSNTHQEVLLSPSIHHTNHSDLGDLSFSSSLSPSLASKRFRNSLTRSTPNWTCLCSNQMNDINEYRKTPIKFNIMKNFNNECDNLIQNKVDSKRIHRTHDHHIGSNDNNLVNLSSLLLSSSSSSTSSPSSTSFECARSFIRLRNARERERVRCVNAGYESLRRHLPLTILPDRRLAKVEILRGAINYINKLKELLEK